MTLIEAGGAVVTRAGDGDTEVLIIHRNRYDDWTLPKGKTEPAEPLPATAVREVSEETGVRIRLGVPLDQVGYPTSKGDKLVSYWGATALHVVHRDPDHEVDVVQWLPITAALKRLTFDHDRFILQQFLKQPATTPLILVRHAKAMDRKSWQGKDAARPINARGHRQAEALVPILSAFGTRSLVSSSSNRCISTLLPYATSRELTIDRHGILSEEEGADDPVGVSELITKILKATGKSQTPTAICCHRQVLPHILAGMSLPERSLATAESLVAHVTADGAVHAIEVHPSLA